MNLWLARTNKGRVVYDRKPHEFTTKDVVRVIRHVFGPAYELSPTEQRAWIETNKDQIRTAFLILAGMIPSSIYLFPTPMYRVPEKPTVNPGYPDWVPGAIRFVEYASKVLEALYSIISGIPVLGAVANLTLGLLMDLLEQSVEGFRRRLPPYHFDFATGEIRWR